MSGTFNIPLRVLNVVQVPDLDYVSSLILDNVSKATARISSIHSGNSVDTLIPRILSQINVDNVGDTTLYRKTKRDLVGLCSSNGITNSSGPGSVYGNLLYSPNDFVMSVDFGLHSVRSSAFKTMQPLKVLTHDELELRYSLGGTSSKFSVLALDIPMLAVQYKGWKEHKLINKNNETVADFVNKYVYQNAVPSQILVTLRNRLKHGLNRGVFDGTPDESLGIFLFDVNDRLNKTISFQLNRIKTGVPTPNEMLSELMLLEGVPYYKGLAMPPQNTSVFSYWLANMAYVSWVSILTLWDGNFLEEDDFRTDLRRNDRIVNATGTNKFIPRSIRDQVLKQHDQVSKLAR